jgi:hypothetical protein
MRRASRDEQASLVADNRICAQFGQSSYTCGVVQAR